MCLPLVLSLAPSGGYGCCPRPQLPLRWGRPGTTAGPWAAGVDISDCASARAQAGCNVETKEEKEVLTRTIRTVTSSFTTPRGGATPLPRRAQPLLLLFRSNRA